MSEGNGRQEERYAPDTASEREDAPRHAEDDGVDSGAIQLSDGEGMTSGYIPDASPGETSSISPQPYPRPSVDIPPRQLQVRAPSHPPEAELQHQGPPSNQPTEEFLDNLQQQVQRLQAQIDLVRQNAGADTSGDNVPDQPAYSPVLSRGRAMSYDSQQDAFSVLMLPELEGEDDDAGEVWSPPSEADASDLHSVPMTTPMRPPSPMEEAPESSPRRQPDAATATDSRVRPFEEESASAPPPPPMTPKTHAVLPDPFTDEASRVPRRHGRQVSFFYDQSRRGVEDASPTLWQEDEYRLDREDLPPHWLQLLRSWLNRHGKEFLVWAVVLVSIGVRTAFGFYDVATDNLLSEFGWSVILSRGTAAGLQLASPMLLLTMTPWILSMLWRLGAGDWLPVHIIRTDMHYTLAYIIGFLSVLHTTGHVATLIRFHDAELPDGASSKLRDYFTATGTLLGYTAIWSGLLMLLMLAILFVGLCSGRCCSSFGGFLASHRTASMLFYALLMAHGTQRLLAAPLAYQFAIPFFVVFVGDRIVRWYNRRVVPGRNIQCDLLEGKYPGTRPLVVLRLRPVRRYGPEDIVPGDYVHLSCRAAGLLSRPFTVAGPTLGPNGQPDGGVEIHMEVFNTRKHNWTYEFLQGLRYSLNHPYRALPRVEIDGPFVAPASANILRDRKYFLLFASGIGVTPMLAIWGHLIRHPVQVQDGLVYMVWTTRMASHVKQVLQHKGFFPHRTPENTLWMPDNFRLDVYLTTKTESRGDSEAFDRDMRELEELTRGTRVVIHKGRFDKSRCSEFLTHVQNRLMQERALANRDRRSRNESPVNIHVFNCGRALVPILTEEFDFVHRHDGYVHYVFHNEAFG